MVEATLKHLLYESDGSESRSVADEDQYLYYL
jgi:hypothetical protein